MQDIISIRGARQHNLKNIDLDIPRNSLVVITGPSGSGKSSLAFDTIYAEGQRRYVESLATYARQFLDVMDKPDVDSIEGLSPAIAIMQRNAVRNSRSTVGTVTEIYDHLRLLFARTGSPHCPICGKEIERYTVEQAIDRLLRLPDGQRIQILAPLVRAEQGGHMGAFEHLRKEGYVRARVDGTMWELDKNIPLDKSATHTIEAVIDRLVVRPDINSRLADSLETALSLANGVATIDIVDREEWTFSTRFACTEGHFEIDALEPRLFSFNSPHGACPECRGAGTVALIDPDRVVPDGRLSILEGAVAPWGIPKGKRQVEQLQRLSTNLSFDLATPFESLPKNVQQALLHGAKSGKFAFDGLIPELQRKQDDATSEDAQEKVAIYARQHTCPKCLGTRLRPEALAVTLNGQTIADLSNLGLSDLAGFFQTLKLVGNAADIAAPLLIEIQSRLHFLQNVGVDYLSLSRSAATLSGGEFQRMRLATQIGSRLVGVIYVLDEPSIGLHPRDNRKLIGTFCQLRDLGNSVIVVEHDSETMRSADYLIDLGPGAGENGGTLTAQGTPEQVMANPHSITGAYLSETRTIPRSPSLRSARGHITLSGASGHNLKSVTVRIPLGVFVCITGVSGSGKSSLINGTLYPELANRIHRAKQAPLPFAGIEGDHQIDKVIRIDQAAIGRTPRSNAATYTNLFTAIRDLYALLPEAKIRGYGSGRFSFNLKGGRCEVCQGEGVRKIEMHFLPDVFVTCDACGGSRYNRETLEVRYKGSSIADVLNMTVETALTFFRDIPQAQRQLESLANVGLGYLRLGQPATALSGGEAQRVKLASELSRTATGNTLYLLDEPTTGLHFEDIRVLINVLDRLVDKGNTILVIEHNLDVIKRADWIIDLGPEGGEAGGHIMASGTPEQIAQDPISHTGRFLKEVLSP
ncbi:MAG: excinuclease ABC subunit UvrA [bacterium]|nr:excinuclease ABC subunit UvrA [bacterium]